MSLINVSLKLWSLNMAKRYMLIFLLKKLWVAFAFAKATHIFSKYIPELDIVLTRIVNILTRTVNILTTNELVKLAMLWTTGPRMSPSTVVPTVLRLNAYTNLSEWPDGSARKLSALPDVPYRRFWPNCSATLPDACVVRFVLNDTAV